LTAARCRPFEVYLAHQGRSALGAEAPRKHLKDPAPLFVERYAVDVLKQRRCVTVGWQGDPELHAAQAARSADLSRIAESGHV
jgi:hypothetical protein